MRSKLIATLLLFTTVPAFAEADWVNLGGSDDGIQTTYVDGASIRINGPVRRFWVRTDFTNERHGWKQSKALHEDNCATDQWRTLQVVIYKIDGTNVDFTMSDQSWEYVPPDSIASAIHDFICRK